MNVPIPPVPTDPMITGMFAVRPARSISDRSRFTASRGKAEIPIPSEKGPASVVPASQAMKWGACASASSNAAPLIPPPTLPTGDMNRICLNLSVAISYADRLRFHPGQVTFAATLCMIRGYCTSTYNADRMCQRSVWICKEQALWLVSRGVLLYILIERKDPAASSL